MKRIIYLSTATKLMSDLQLNNLLETARKQNFSKNITGLLIYMDGNFLQIIEGDDLEVNNLFNKISFDKRHKNIICVNDEIIEKRQFPDWNMGFKATSYNILNKEHSYRDLNSDKLYKFNDKTSLNFIKTFVRSYGALISY